MDVLIIHMYLSMENRIFTRIKYESLLITHLSIMKEESLCSKIDTDDSNIIMMSYFRYMYEKPVSAEYYIGTLFDRLLELL